MKNLLQVAINEFGIKEIKGPRHNQRIIKYAQDSKFTWINDDETAWCSTFMNWVAIQAGLQHSKSASARSWLNVGFETQNPEPGDVVVFWRDSINSQFGHVGIYLGYAKDQSRIYVLGGNQGDAVSISAYPAARLLSFRRLTNTTAVRLPASTLEKGSRGSHVVAIQNALKVTGYNPGTSDGIFGIKTQQALERLQSTSPHIKNTGIYNSETKKLMESLLANKA
ncbi:TIGR02594 family protein [Lacinutrix neustonica]|uniref:TIGR02594 family protein n=1 Tax=Lacinutrix neustonica TaxID=2980107 RepID=A0A9E8MYQ1_9FLAO|nr:TIGR02594 family protein [Lacinutrix neustonica]WAC03466.1 TIGR02594 family protein [Lacinutrix neustonica]